MTDKLETLLPCPFCGGPAEIQDGGFRSYRVTCSDYEGCVKFMRVSFDDPDCHSKLVRAWNRRVVVNTAGQGA
jgi:ssDNA-binding Zn-finger/Zn-ribbon topoisomerase 1